MALCPFATHKLIAPGSSDPRITARVAILHVDAGNAESLYDYFKNRSGGIESHFFIKVTGKIEQYRDTAFQADANYLANDFAISIETQGFGNGKWTKAQLRSIKRLLLWLNEVHDIPLRKIQVWDGSGVGYHVQFGAPGKWTPVSKSCPGPERIKQFNTALVRWFRSNPAAPPAPTPAPPEPDTLKVIARNLYTASDSEVVLANLEAEVEKYDPDVIALSEAASHAKALKRFATKHGFTLLQEPVAPDRARGDDTGDCALLVAGDVKIRRDWVSVMTRTWKVFSHNVTHEPHAYQNASLKVRGRRWRVRASHWPTHGFAGGNHAAVAESARASKAWLRGIIPSVDVGDLNESASVLAEWYGKRFKVFGKGIDVAVTRRVASCEWKELPKGGSDHNGRFYKFTAKGS